MPAAIVAEGLVKQYGDVRALDGMDLTVPEGTVFGLLGPNGAGKTTTVRILTASTPGPGRTCGRSSPGSSPGARRCCSPPNTWRRPTGWPTASRWSTTGA